MALDTRALVQAKINGGCRLDPDAVLMVRCPDRRLLRVVSRSLLFAVLLLTLCCIGFFWRSCNPPQHIIDESPPYFVDAKFLDMIIYDLLREGLVKNGDDALVIIPRMDVGGAESPMLTSSDVNLVITSDLEKEISLRKRAFDAVFLFASQDVKSVDHVVKIGGILVCEDSFAASEKQPNYSVVYLRQFESTISAMRKMFLQQEVSSTTSRKLLGGRKAALDGLENVLLEPPRKKMMKKKTTQKFNFLPELLHDDLGGYPRRVFLEVGIQEEEGKGAVSWFKENYPMGEQKFELHSVENRESGGGVSNWLRKNVREEDFVVMKAEAGVAEEMMKTKTIALVDELFLECHCQWRDGKAKRTTRAYWECLNLYGRLRDEGVAVHQWWG